MMLPDNAKACGEGLFRERFVSELADAGKMKRRWEAVQKLRKCHRNRLGLSLYNTVFPLQSEPSMNFGGSDCNGR